MERINKLTCRVQLHQCGCLHFRKQPKSCLLADERQTVIVTTAAQDEILETVRVVIRIRRLRHDIASFFQQHRTQLAGVRVLSSYRNSKTTRSYTYCLPVENSRKGLKTRHLYSGLKISDIEETQLMLSVFFSETAFLYSLPFDHQLNCVSLFPVFRYCKYLRT